MNRPQTPRSPFPSSTPTPAAPNSDFNANPFHTTYYVVIPGRLYNESNINTVEECPAAYEVARVLGPEAREDVINMVKQGIATYDQTRQQEGRSPMPVRYLYGVPELDSVVLGDAVFPVSVINDAHEEYTQAYVAFVRQHGIYLSALKKAHMLHEITPINAEPIEPTPLHVLNVIINIRYNPDVRAIARANSTLQAEARRTDIKNLYNTGMPIQIIADKIGMSRASVYNAIAHMRATHVYGIINKQEYRKRAATLTLNAMRTRFAEPEHLHRDAAETLQQPAPTTAPYNPPTPGPSAPSGPSGPSGPSAPSHSAPAPAVLVTRHPALDSDEHQEILAKARFLLDLDGGSLQGHYNKCATDYLATQNDDNDNDNDNDNEDLDVGDTPEIDAPNSWGEMMKKATKKGG